MEILRVMLSLVIMAVQVFLLVILLRQGKSLDNYYMEVLKNQGIQADKDDPLEDFKTPRGLFTNKAINTNRHKNK